MALTKDDEALLKAIYQRIADQPLLPNDPAYESIYDQSEGGAEGGDPMAKIGNRIEWAPTGSVQLFSGFRGTGKTTELLRLKHDLETKGCLVLYANALDYFSPSEPIDITTMLLGVAGAFGEQMEEVLGVSVLGQSFWQRISHYLTQTTVEVSELSANVEGGANALLGDLKAGLDLKFALKTASSFHQNLQDFLGKRLSQLKIQVDRFVEESVKKARKENPDRQIVFLFDQFEQLRGSLYTEKEVIQSVTKLFTQHLDKLKLPYVHAVYTVPPWLRFTCPGALNIEILPCVRLWGKDPERTRHEAGLRHLRSVVKKRFEPEGFQRIFGDGEDGQARADRLIEMSGGHFRDLLLLLQKTLLLIKSWRPSLPVAHEVLEQAIVDVRRQFLPIALDDARWLHQIGLDRQTNLKDTSPENVDRLSRFLDTHLVLYLTNGEDWYDLHPLVREEVRTLAKQSAEKEGVK
jgi:hypothetical protein